MGLKDTKTRCQIIIRKELKKEIEELAIAESRSFSNMVSVILEQYIKEHKQD